jgi:hypothetical protein
MIKSIPTLHLSEEDLPEIKNWDVDKTYNLIVKVKMTGKNAGEEFPVDSEGEKDKKIRARFEVIKVKAPDYKDPFEMSKKEFAKAKERGYQGKPLYE